MTLAMDFLPENSLQTRGYCVTQQLVFFCCKDVVVKIRIEYVYAEYELYQLRANDIVNIERNSERIFCMSGYFGHHVFSAIPGGYGRKQFWRFRKPQYVFRFREKHIDPGNLHMARQIEKISLEYGVVEQILF